MTAGFLVVDKPSGPTSNAVVSKVRRVTGIKKVGHAGTLDPMATGAVVVAIGRVTRLIKYLQDQPKEYRATALFGVTTDTLDAHGAILGREPMAFAIEDLEAAAVRFVGRIHQVPPMVSAIKRDGRRLYELAREGQVVEREARPVEIYELEILSVGAAPYPEVELRVVCGKGTYIRSLADDLAAALGGGAHLTALRRTRIGSLSVGEHGVAMDHLEDWRNHLLSASEALADLPAITVTSAAAARVSNGVRLSPGEFIGEPTAEQMRVLDESGYLLAVYRRADGSVVPDVVLAP